MPGTEAGKSGFYIDRFRRVSKWNVETVETENGSTLKWQEIQLWDDVQNEWNWNLFLISIELKCGIFQCIYPVSFYISLFCEDYTWLMSLPTIYEDSHPRIRRSYSISESLLHVWFILNLIISSLNKDNEFIQIHF